MVLLQLTIQSMSTHSIFECNQLYFLTYRTMLEFLLLNGKFEAAKQFNQTSQTTLRQQLLNHFSKGNRVQFMDLFTMLRKQSKLQFYLRVYFLVFSIHPSLRGKGSIPQPEKVAFKDYLDTKGAQLAKTSEFLQFYALPFIKKPLQHLAFKNLFKKQWVSNLKQKLQMYIGQQQRHLKNEASKVFQQHQSSSSSPTTQNNDKMWQQRVKQMQKINKKLFQEVKQFTEKYHVLEDNHKLMIDSFNTHMMEAQSKWFQITKQLVQCSKSLIQMLITSDSDFITDRKFLKIKKKTQKYQRFVNKKFDDLVSHSQDISIFDRPSISDLSYSVPIHTQKNLTSHSHTQLLPQVEDYIPTDFQSLKQHIKKSSIPQKISLLNGLYWRILKSKTKEIRKLNILGILHFDVLGIKTGEIAQMLVNRQLMKPTVRLIQLISLDNLGKRIAFSGDLIRDFVGLVGQCQDSGCFEYVVTVLAQISSEKQFKMKLIQQDIIEVCVDILRTGKYSKNQTVLQSSIAVMLNMLEKTEGLKKYQREKDIFAILKQCLYSNFKITRALIYGIIFALLQSEQLFKRAHQQNLPQFFDRILEIDPTINRTQLRFLKNKLSKFQPKQERDNQDENQQEEDGADDDQDYDIEEELVQELEEMMKVHEEVLKKFGLKGKEAIMQAKEVKELLEQWRDNRVPKFNSPEQNKKIQKLASPKPKTSEVLIENQSHHIRNPIHEDPILNRGGHHSQVGPTKKTNNFMEPATVSDSKSNVYQNQNIYNSNSNYDMKAKQKERPNRMQVERLSDIKTKQKEREKQKQSKYRDKDLQNNNESDRRMKKSVSADRGIGRNIENNKIYQSNKFSNNNKVSEFKAAAEDRNYRSPQQKKPRDQVLKQINQQIRAEQMMRQRKRAMQNRDNALYSSERNQRPQQSGEAFQSRPKLRRTPPRQ